MLGVGCWVLGVGCWGLGVGGWGLGVGGWGLGIGCWVTVAVQPNCVRDCSVNPLASLRVQRLKRKARPVGERPNFLFQMPE